MSKLDFHPCKVVSGVGFTKMFRSDPIIRFLKLGPILNPGQESRFWSDTWFTFRSLGIYPVCITNSRKWFYIICAVNKIEKVTYLPWHYKHAEWFSPRFSMWCLVGANIISLVTFKGYSNGNVGAPNIASSLKKLLRAAVVRRRFPRFSWVKSRLKLGS